MGNAQTRFEALVNAYSADLYRFAYWLCRDRARAEDLVQETFLRAWRALAGLREEKAAKGWLLTILRHEHARFYERPLPVLESDDPDTLSGPEAPSDDDELLRRALASLPLGYREPLLLQVLGGYRCEEIAQMLRLAPGTVMTRLFRARRRLRLVLEQSGSDRSRHRIAP
jgi:RNA polymerase sigma-70 factor (ECF subfamily)